MTRWRGCSPTSTSIRTSSSSTTDASLRPPAERPASSCACIWSVWTTARRWHRPPRGAASWREGGQARFIEHPVPRDTDRSTSATRLWALDRLAEPVTLKDMARHAHTSERTFTGRFRGEVGSSPLKRLAQQRLAHARLLLASTDLTVARIATAYGFGDPVALRKHFHTYLGPVTAGLPPRPQRSGPDDGTVTAHDVMRLLRPGGTLKITRHDRLSRSVLYLVPPGAELRQRGIGLHAIERGIGTARMEGRAMFGMLSVLAELPCELIVANRMDRATVREDHDHEALTAGSRLGQRQKSGADTGTKQRSS
ncbi:helix-turn-helix domain-containing protein [Streptomyces sp. NPDC088923]|uniref:helix-turn-helix domain-containing protein n=1 Tax=Streptomyces sp. NPDC088923 TaxID=3365913 RepID=UPI003823D34C